MAVIMTMEPFYPFIYYSFLHPLSVDHRTWSHSGIRDLLHPETVFRTVPGHCVIPIGTGYVVILNLLSCFSSRGRCFCKPAAFQNAG